MDANMKVDMKLNAKMNTNRKSDAKSKYDDIIDLQYHKSTAHPQMSLEERAAQFSPFAALTGHDAAIAETARLTDVRIEPDEDLWEHLDRKLAEIRQRLSEHPEVSVVYFKPDAKKEGGCYCTHRGLLKKIDDFRQLIVFSDGMEIGIGDIVEILDKIY